MFQRIAIVNRGEAAMRLIHAVRDLNAENPGGPQTTTIALFTDGERSAMFAADAWARARCRASSLRLMYSRCS